MGKARLWEVKWVAQENSATERQSRAVTSLCTPAGTCAAAGPAVDIGIQSTGEDKCCDYRPLPRFTLPAWSLQASWGTMSSFVIEDSPGVRIALSPSRWFNYLKLFLSKDRKVNSLSAPHLTYKKEIELLLFFSSVTLWWNNSLENSAVFQSLPRSPLSARSGLNSIKCSEFQI